MRRTVSVKSDDPEFHLRQGKEKQRAVAAVLTTANVSALALFLARSGKFPILINEGIVGFNLLVTQESGGMCFPCRVIRFETHKF